MRSTSFSVELLANGQVLIKILSSFLSLIPLDGKKRRNKGAFGKKTSSKAAFLVLPLYNSSENAFLPLLLYPLIVSSSLCLSAAKLGVCVFSKNNAGKGKGDDPRSTGVDGRTGAEDPGKRIDADPGADDLCTVTDDLSTATDDPGTVTDNSSISVDDLSITADDTSTAIDNSGTKTDADKEADDPGKAADDPGIGTDADAGADNLGTAASNKACACAVSFFALRRALFLLASSSELVTASLPSSLPFSSSTTSQSKLVLSCSVILVNQGAIFFKYLIDEIWKPSLSKVSSEISTMVRISYFLAKYS